MAVPKNVKDPAVALGVASYSLGMAVIQLLEGRLPTHVTEKDIDNWLKVADSPYIDHYAEIHDAHAEFTVFDGLHIGDMIRST